MNNQVIITVILFLGLTFASPLSIVNAEKLDSDEAINETSNMETEEKCDDTIHNDNNGKIADGDEKCVESTSPVADTCELEIVSGDPIDYGQLIVGQQSDDQSIIAKNTGTADSKIIAKGGDWIDDVTGKPVISTQSTMIALRDITPFVILDSDEFSVGELHGGERVEILFKFKGANNDITGSFHQEVTLDLDC